MDSRVLGLLLLIGCAARGPSSAGTAAGAIPLVAIPTIAEAAIYHDAAHYACWAVCPESMRCNAATHLCEPGECRGGCPIGQLCDLALHPPRCLVDMASLRLWKDREGPAPLSR
ncbi:MAG TPA: hypothetical protein VMB50_07570 [Myxococcales bacterium]|nr:hypothetical protein [Myxococcales bacterium]